jgi:hypothetical protein
MSSLKRRVRTPENTAHVQQALSHSPGRLGVEFFYRKFKCSNALVRAIKTREMTSTIHFYSF